MSAKTIKWMGGRLNITKRTEYGFVCNRDGIELVVMQPGLKGVWHASIGLVEHGAEVSILVTGHASHTAALADLEALVRRVARLP